MQIRIVNTADAKAESNTLTSIASSFESIINSLSYFKNTLAEVWTSGSEIESVNSNINNCLNEYNSKIIPAIKKLANGTLAYCMATESLADNGISDMSPSKWTEANYPYNFTETSEYDSSKLDELILNFEGAPTDGNGNYKVYTDSDGSLTAGPGLHLSHYGLESEVHNGVISKEKVDAAYGQYVSEVRTSITNCLETDKYSSLNLNDAQVDSLTSLLYNTGKNPEYFLDKCVEAQNSGTSLYDYCTKYWVTDGTNTLQGLVKRRAAEAVLFEKGYDAYYEFMKTGSV